MPGLTGVVGPNGCGKSNLLEAIRWVMGEGSPKSLRGSAMDDVIFAGTASRPQRQFAEVSILAERTDDEVEVVRRIERGAGSAYRINGRDARARDAQLIFADAATGAHSPALVSQGRIGAIIAAKPAERRQMLEEAAAISGLHVRRREAEIRLKATEANLARVAETVAEQDARIAVLRRQSRTAERYRKLSDDIRTAEGRLIYARWRDAAAAADVARAEAQAADEAVHSASEAQRVAAALSADAGDKLGEARTSAQRARDAAADARHALATVEAERATVDTRIASIAAQIDQLAADHAREGELARDAGEALTRLGAEIAETDRRIKAAAEERPALADALARAEDNSRAAEVALAQALARGAQEAAERRVAEAALAAATFRLERATGARNRAAAELAAIGDLSLAKKSFDDASSARAAAEVACGQAVEAIAMQEVLRTAAEESRAITQRDAATAAAALAAVEAEAAALRRDSENIMGALQQVRAAPGYETALAAALADDLSAAIGTAGPRRWTGAAIRTNDPPLSVGQALSAHVEAPRELARRLAQIAVVAVDDGAALAVGQRLVTLDGKMRRWDGFASDGAGSAAAEGLKRRNRLAAIEAQLPQMHAAHEAAAAARDTAALAVAETGQQLADARRESELAEATLRAALRQEDQAVSALERAARLTKELSERVVQSDAEVVAAARDLQIAQSGLDALPAFLADGIARQLDRAAQAARDMAAQCRADLAARDGRHAADKARHDAARTEQDDWRARSGKAGKRVEDMAKRARTLSDEQAGLADAPARIAERVAALGIEAARRAETAQAAVAAERAADATLRDREASALAAAERLANTREVRAGAQARTENQELRRVEMGRVAGERFECPAALLPEKLAFDASTVGTASEESTQLERLATDRERLGPVNLVAASELTEIEAGRENNAAEIAELTEAVHRLRGSIGSLNREGRARLRAAFDAVDGHFRTLFAILFNGGEAYLSMIDSDDPLDAGLEIMAQPPGKKLSSLTLLSGGEQALTAAALIFALFLTNPAPLCVLDEVDAPLDDANVERFCDLLDAMARDTDTRYLIVTHNAVTMARMHRLYGVTMIEQGVSRLVSVDLGSAEALLAAE